MNFYYLGIDHKRTSLEKREEAYRMREEIEFFCRHMMTDAAALFTCNRIEVYGVAESEKDAVRDIGLFRDRFPNFYREAYVEYSTRGALRHSLRLATGLESQLIGEKEILKQLRSWSKRLSSNSQLRYFWDKVILNARKIRMTSGFNQVNADIAKIVLKELSESKKIVVVGTGKVADLFAENNTNGIEMIFVARKKHKKAKQLARKASGSAVLVDHLSEEARDADILVSATSSPHYVISLEQMFEISRSRRKDLYIFDLAVPRDIEPGAGNIPGIFIKNIDDLITNFDNHNVKLLPRIKRAELLIEKEIKVLQKETIKNAVKSRYKAQPIGIETG